MKKISWLIGLGALLTVLLAPVGQAHEFWIEPEGASAQVGVPLKVRLYVGQHLRGNQQPYITSWFEAFMLHDAQGSRPVKGMMGDIPALSMKPRTSGLQIVHYWSTPDRLKYLSAEQFARFIDYEGLTTLKARHEARNLPPFGFEEDYVRCAKALVPVEDATGADRLIGMPIELLAEENPYTGAADRLPVRLFWQGEPLADTQIRVFQKTEDVVERTLRTDASGRASIDLAGGGFFLLSAVHLTELDGSNGAVWKSYWASLTFRR